MIELRVLKLDNGYKCRIYHWGGMAKVPHFFTSDRQIRQLKPYPAGSHIVVKAELSKTGRLMIKKHEDMSKTGASVPRLTILPVTVAPQSTIQEATDMIIEEDVTVPIEQEEVAVLDTSIHPLSPKEIESLLTGYHISEEARMAFTSAYHMSKARPERAVKIMMVGPSGYGKTTLPYLFSRIIGMQHMRMNCATIRDPEEWFGFREAREGSTVFIKSRFAQMLEAGNAVVVLDEFNRLEPWLHNTLFPLLDDDGKTVVHDEEFRIGPNVLVVGTINTGYRYTGTFELDEALSNRFEFMLEVGAMKSDQEETVLVARAGIDKAVARSIVKMANILRQTDIICSTRTSLNIAFQVHSGMTVREAFEVSVVRRIPQDSAGSNPRKVAVDKINTELGPFQTRTLKEDVFTVGIYPLKATEKEAPVAKAKGNSADKVPTFLLRQAEGKTINVVNTIRLIRLLPTEETLSFQRAEALVHAMKMGKEIIVPLTIPLGEDEEKFNKLVGEFKESNVSGRYSNAHAKTSVGIVEESE